MMNPKLSWFRDPIVRALLTLALRLRIGAGLNFIKEKLEQARKGPPDSDLITVCDKCLRASCWQGIWMCEESKWAGIIQKTKKELRDLDRENPSYWKTDEELAQ